MSSELLEYVNNHVVEIGPNMYEVINGDEIDFNHMTQDLKELIIKAKSSFIESGGTLEIDDLYLLRTNDELPEDLKYKSYSRLGKYIDIDNPLLDSLSFFGLGIPSDSSLLERTRLVCQAYRDTLHFSLNGLVSDTYNCTFTDRECVVIEPFKGHLTDKLININPVDTMFDVKESDQPIDDQAIFIFSKRYFESLSDEVKATLFGRKIYLFDQTKFVVCEKARNNNLLMTVTDFVLCHNGILPQHSHGQSALWEEYFSDYDDNDEEIYISDKKYLKEFTELIDRISKQRFAISYYEKNSNGSVGVMHVDTEYFSDELKQNIMNQENVTLRYLDFLFDKGLFPLDFITEIKKRASNYFEMSKTASHFPIVTSFATDEELKEYINKDTISSFIQATLEFNEEEKNRIKQNSSVKVSEVDEDRGPGSFHF